MVSTSLPLLTLAGGAGSGKSTIARELAAEIPGLAVIHLDDCYHDDPRLAPTVDNYDGGGQIVNFSHPRSIDLARVDVKLAECAEADLVLVEGLFALSLPALRERARWSAYIDVPADIRIARKTIRKIDEGRNPRHVLRGYLEHGREAFERHVAPTRAYADLVLDGTAPVPDLVKQLRLLCTA